MKYSYNREGNIKNINHYFNGRTKTTKPGGRKGVLGFATRYRILFYYIPSRGVLFNRG